MSSPEQHQEDVGAACNEPDRVVGEVSKTPEPMLIDPKNDSRNGVMKDMLVKIQDEFSHLCVDDARLRTAAESFLNSVIDCVTLGVVFNIYREIKMGAYSATVVRMEQLLDDKNKTHSESFADYYDDKRKCACLKCSKMFQATGFASHLQKCMKIASSRTRNARQVVAAPKDSSTYYESNPSSDNDNDDDADWSRDGKKRKKKRDRNGTKRVKGTPTKKTETEIEPEILDVEGDSNEVVVYEEEEADEDIFSLSEFFVDGSSSSQSYATPSSEESQRNISSDESLTKINLSSSPTLSS